MTPQERDLAIRTLLAEAGREGPAGMAAVANVILNRAKSGRYGQGVGGVVMKKAAFEPWSDHVRGTANDPRRFDPKSKEYAEAGDILDAAAGGVIPDITGGSTHFFAPKAQAALGRNAPAWARGPGKAIGNHTFFAPEGKSMYDPSGFDMLSRSSAPMGVQQPKPIQGLLPTPPSAPGAPSGGMPSMSAPSMQSGMPSMSEPSAPKQPGSWGDVFGGWAGDGMGDKRSNPLAFRLLQYAMQPSAGSGGPGPNAGGGLPSAIPSAPPMSAAGNPQMGGPSPSPMGDMGTPDLPQMGGPSAGGKPDLPGILGMFSKMFSGPGGAGAPAAGAAGPMNLLSSAMPQIGSAMAAPAAAGASAAAPAAATAAPAALSALTSLFAAI